MMLMFVVVVAVVLMLRVVACCGVLFGCRCCVASVVAVGVW